MTPCGSLWFPEGPRYWALTVAVSSYFVAKKTAESQAGIETARLRATLITSERLRWLQDIRQRLSRLYREMDMQYNHLKRPVVQAQSASFQGALDAQSGEIMEQSSVITLMLNPGKPEQQALRTAVNDALLFMLECFRTTKRRS